MVGFPPLRSFKDMSLGIMVSKKYTRMEAIKCAILWRVLVSHISMVDWGSKLLFLENNQGHRITVCMWKALLPLRISWNFMLSTPVVHCRIWGIGSEGP